MLSPDTHRRRLAQRFRTSIQIDVIDRKAGSSPLTWMAGGMPGVVEAAPFRVMYPVDVALGLVERPPEDWLRGIARNVARESERVIRDPTKARAKWNYGNFWWIVHADFYRSKLVLRQSGCSTQIWTRFSEGNSVLHLAKCFGADESGATAIEYGLIAAGIAVAIIHVVGSLGSQLKTTFSAITSQLAAVGK
jgi:pilus assembly protein Flp/PilA